ncbi:MAG: hypothetical protein HQL41_17350 [Alphaproteobacteria bacterium]|nr:hypothetical protein [Alphaproteobacteria bacterium]
MRLLMLGLLLLLPAFDAAAQDNPAQLPWGRGFPVMVRAGIAFVDLKGIDENEGTFTATVDVRLRWRDLRRKFPASEAGANGYMDFWDDAAERKLTEIWHPHATLANLVGEPEYQKRTLRIAPDGQVEILQRTTGTFTADFPLDKFPFDRQKLAVRMVSRLESTQKVAFDYRQDEVEFSNTRYFTEIDGWEMGLVELSQAPVPAWRGDKNTGMEAALVIQRDQPSLVATIFVPLMASLLIPLLTVWLNKAENGEFAVDGFELTNISIGGLFAVVGLNFTINSTYVNLATGDNPVMRLFALNYFLLGLTIAIGMLLYRFHVVKLIWGPHIQDELFVYLNWALPVMTFGAAGSMIALAVF